MLIFLKSSKIITFGWFFIALH